MVNVGDWAGVATLFAGTADWVDEANPLLLPASAEAGRFACEGSVVAGDGPGAHYTIVRNACLAHSVARSISWSRWHEATKSASYCEHGR